ncbi:MAG: lipoyl(octanoyl) transferase LipB [Hyphomicrobiaceae bacterium]
MNQNSVEWAISQGHVPYLDAVATMEARAEAIRAGTAAELIWLLEHPPLYTAGTSAQKQDLLTPDRFPVYQTGRGGQYTYHGPGQRVAYVMMDITKRGRDVRRFVVDLENWLITALAAWNIDGGVRDDRVGVWVNRPDKGPSVEDKIAAIGIRMRRWVSFHGISLNVAPDLSHFDGIVPCGISQHGVTSLQNLGHMHAMPDIDDVLCRAFETTFQRQTIPAVAPLQPARHLATGRLTA